MNTLRAWLLGLLTIVIAPACGPAGDGFDSGKVTGPPSLQETADGINGAPTSTYYTVRRDLALCPLCGGVFVKRVNDFRRPVYVADIDYSALGLDEDALLRVREMVERGKGLLRGDLLPGTTVGRTSRVFAATEAWLASSGAHPPSGSFYRLQNNGIVCITVPCFSLHVARLNWPFDRDVSDLDLAPSGAPQGELDRAYEALGPGTEGILATGFIRPVPNAGPAGTGRKFVASQFYLRVGSKP